MKDQKYTHKTTAICFLDKSAKIYFGAQTDYLTNCPGKSRQPHVQDPKWIII